MGAKIFEFKKEHIPAVIAFSDREIGDGYYNQQDLLEVLARSTDGSINCSFVLIENERVVGIRLAYPPGNWQTGKGQGLLVEKWPHPIEETGYFQSLFIDPKHQRKGWGRSLSEKALESLIMVGAKAVACHSWKESPGNSSAQYLEKMGFQVVGEHPKYWKEVDYTCVLCDKPCVCTAQEMILNLEP